MEFNVYSDTKWHKIRAIKAFGREKMKNLGIFCIGIIIFSVGIILGAELNAVTQNKQVEAQVSNRDSLQDTVIKNVQMANVDEKNAKELENEKNATEVIATEKKISPYATMTIEKYFKGCGHTTLETIDIPKELVNMTKEELQEKYDKWKIKKFEEQSIYLYREIDANCMEHFFVKEMNGKVVVFLEVTDQNKQQKEVTNIQFEALREEDKELLKEGIEIYGEEALSSFIEDFNS